MDACFRGSGTPPAASGPGFWKDFCLSNGISENSWPKIEAKYQSQPTSIKTTTRQTQKEGPAVLPPRGSSIE